MTEEKLAKKRAKKAYKKALHKAVRPWKGLSVFTGILTVLLAAVLVFVTLFDNTIAAFTGGGFHKLVNEDESAVYYDLDFNSIEELAQYGLDICEQVEAEGAALLMNENNALPLNKGNKVSLISNSSVNLVYGGTGSGNIDASKADNLKSALEKVNVKVNETLWNFYTEGAGKDIKRGGGTGVVSTGATINEVPMSVYDEATLNSIKEYGDAAIVVISRVGGEGADCTYLEDNYLALDATEREMMAAVKDMKAKGDVKKIVVLINSANAVQVDFLKNNEYNVDAVLWIGDVGITGVNAVAKILVGDVNPSGGLADTYLFNNYSSPAMQNFTPVVYTGDTSKVPGSADTYMIYQEGIYVGYKYYETRYEDVVMGTGNAGNYKYSDDVAYPFGYGLSYTTFELSGMNVEYNAIKDIYTVSVTVTNTGAKAGKNTVEVYVQSPYTDYDIKNGVEKAAVSLCGFGKTKELAPGASEVLKIEVDRADIASYDYNGAKTYIIDAGDWYFTAASDAHEAVNNILAAKGYTKADGMDAEGNVDLVYGWVEEALDAKTYSVSKAGVKVTNQLSMADPNLYDGVNEKVTWLSRNNWTGTWPKTVNITLTEKLIAALQDVTYNPDEHEKVAMPTLNAKNGLSLYDMIGKDYDDPMWEQLLDQMSFDEMVSLIGDSFHFTMPVESVNAPGTRDENGPQGLTASLFGGVEIESTAFTSEDVMAATFNTDLMYEVGKIIGNDCVAAGITVLYGPGNNIHRVPFGGRNFEYYSEDGFLSGKISASEVKGIEDKGAHVVMKHFALNDCEQDRLGLGVWVNEQAAREIYLKAFQDVFEEGNGGGVMTAYTRWGATWSGSNPGLMTGIMRGEWGSRGLTITDNVLVQYCNGVDAVMAGGVSTFDAMLWYVTSQLPKFEKDPVVVTAMREACHHNLYAVANSLGMNGVGPNTTVKAVTPKLVTLARVALGVSAVLWVACVVIHQKKKRAFKASYVYEK